MKTPDQLQKITDAHKDQSAQYMRLLPDTEDITLITLKGHLIIEEILYFIVSKHCSFPKYLPEARLSFSQLSSLAKALIRVPLHDCAFPAISKLNKLRNDLAHNIDSKKAEDLARDFINSCEPQNTSHASLPQQIRHSICYILGQLTVIGSFSEIIKEIPENNLEIE